MTMGKSKKELTDDQRERYEAEALKKRQTKIRKEFEFLEDADTLTFQSEFIKAQAKEICKYYNRIKLTPFRALEGQLRDMINDEDFRYNFYIKENEYGEIVPDDERIDDLVLENIKPEDIVRNMF